MNDFNKYGYCSDCKNNGNYNACKQCYRGSWYERDDRDEDEQLKYTKYFEKFWCIENLYLSLHRETSVGLAVAAIIKIERLFKVNTIQRHFPIKTPHNLIGIVDLQC